MPRGHPWHGPLLCGHDAKHYGNGMCGKCHYAVNQEKMRAQAKVHYAANREKIIARTKVHQTANRETINARRRISRAANPEKVAGQRKRYRAANPEKVTALEVARNNRQPPVVYVWLDRNGQAEYVGRGTRKRAMSHKYTKSWWTSEHEVVIRQCESEWQAMELEGAWGGQWNPRYNKEGYRHMGYRTAA